MKFCYNINSTLPKQCQRSRSVLQDGSRTFGLFWKEKTPSYDRRNTVPSANEQMHAYLFKIGMTFEKVHWNLLLLFLQYFCD